MLALPFYDHTLAQNPYAWVYAIDNLEPPLLIITSIYTQISCSMPLKLIIKLYSHYIAKSVIV